MYRGNSTMHTQATVALLFEEEPVQWGLRGDPHLWRELRTRLADEPLPGSAEQLEDLLARAFLSAVGHVLWDETVSHVYVGRFDTGGMSRGNVSLDFWRHTGFPLVVRRFVTLVQS